MTISPTDFKTRFPEFAGETDPRIQTFIDKALLNLDASVWGNYYVEGQLYLSAHFLKLANDTASGGGSGGAAGPVASRSIGDVSVSFAVASESSDSAAAAYFHKTPYGQEYWRLVKIVGEGLVAVV